MRRFIEATVAVLLLFVLCSPFVWAHEPIVLGDPPTETPAHKSGLISLPDGSVEVYYLREGKNGKEIASRRTTDDGVNWSPAKAILELPGGHVEPWKPGEWITLRPLITRDGELHFFVIRVGNMEGRAGLNQFLNVWYVGSRERRSQWRGPNLLYEGMVGPPRCAIELSSGRIIYPFDHALPDRDTHHPTGVGEVLCAYSDDGGDSWQFSPSKLTTPVNRVYRGANYGALEPVTMSLSDGRLWMLLRTQSGRLFESFSDDEGARWTPTQPTRFYSSSSPADVVRLHDGRIALFWNNTQNAPDVDGSEPYTNRDVLHAAISNDDGLNWHGFREVYRAPHRNISAPKAGTTCGTSYPDAEVTKSNKLLVMAGHGPESAKLLLVDPDWLMETSAESNFDGGLDKWCVYKGVGPIETAWRERVAGTSLISHPDRAEGKVLHVRRPQDEPADGAVWNFPMGKKGTLRLIIRLQPGFDGASIALADRYYDPTDVAGERQALFDLRISTHRQLMSGPALEAGRWYLLEMTWDTDEKTCAVAVDGKRVLNLDLLNPVIEGINYLRLRSLAQSQGDGFIVESVAVNVDIEQPRVASQPRETEPDIINVEPPRVVSSIEAEPGSRYPFRQNMYRALQLPDGRIIALSIAREERQQTMQARYSEDNGKTWTEPEDLFQFPKEAGGFGLFDALVDQDGEIQIATLCDGNSGILFPKEEGSSPPAYDILEIWHVRSENKLTKWSKPKAIRKGRNSDLLSITQLRDGRIVLPICFATHRAWHQRGEGFLDYTLVGGYSSGVMYSDDNGQTWQESPDELSVETPSIGAYGAVEPVVIQLKDSRVWMLMRTQRGRFYESFSEDGARWSPPRPSKLISSDAPAGLIRLKDGGLLLFSNACLRYPYAQGARNVLHGSISYDDGRTWRGFREIARDPHRNEPPNSASDYGVSYSFPTLTNDGQVLFSNWVEQGSIRRFRLLDPKWLLETRQKCDFSNGLDDWSAFGSKGVEVVPAPDNENEKVLSLRKADAQWPAGVVWNFPIGAKGRLSFKLKLNPGFSGINLGLTDHFSTPWDLEDEFHNVFNLPIDSSGELFPGVKLDAGRWYRLELVWDTPRRQCQVFLDEKPIGTIDDNRRSSGVNYLRLRSTSVQPDGGLFIGAIDSDVSESWPRDTSAQQ